nr:ribonuclease H-like domain-containing protein [Tanacetum cinerariifolium]
MADGTLSHYKARLVASGSTQLERVDVDETFSSVVKPGTIQSIFSLAASRHWPIHQLNGTDVAYLLLYVDNIVLTATSEILLLHIIRSIYHEFAMIDLGPLNYFMDISVTCDSAGLFLSQKKYAIEILERAYMINCNSSQTPINTESKLGDDGNPFSRLVFICMIHGSLILLLLSGLQLFSSYTTDLVAYLDADWAGFPTISRSTLEAESRGVNNVVPTTCWLHNLLRELHSHLSSATLVYCDNVNVVYLSCNPVQHQRTKHIEIDIHFVHDLVAAGQVLVLHVPSRYQLVYIFTKGLSRGWVYNDALDAKEVCDGCTQGCPLKIFATLYDIESEEWILDGIWELTSLTEGSNKGAIKGFEGTACSLSLKVDWTYARNH